MSSYCKKYIVNRVLHPEWFGLSIKKHRESTYIHLGRISFVIKQYQS